MLRKITIFALVVIIGGLAYWLISPFLSNSVVYENENNIPTPVVAPATEPVLDTPAVEIESTSTSEPTPAKPTPALAPKPTPTTTPAPTSTDITEIEQLLNSLDLDNLDSGL